MTVIAPEHVIHIALTAWVVGKQYFNFLADLIGVLDIPASLQQHGIDQQGACFSFVPLQAVSHLLTLLLAFLLIGPGRRLQLFDVSGALRSEEHTSELQSRPHLVCRLLLEKKKQTQT